MRPLVLWDWVSDGLEPCGCPSVYCLIGWCRHPRYCPRCGALATGGWTVSLRPCITCSLRDALAAWGDSSNMRSGMTMGQMLRERVLDAAVLEMLDVVEFPALRGYNRTDDRKRGGSI